MSNYNKILQNKKTVIKALKSGVPIKRICNMLRVDRVAFYKVMKDDDDFKIAMEHYQTFVENLFS